MSRLTDEDAREFPAKTVEEGGVSHLRKISAWLGYNSPTRGQASLIKGLRAASGES